jgi:hypothetical protein
VAKRKNKGKQVRKKDDHHFYWPKKLYKKLGIKNEPMTLPYDLHHNYHGHFMSRCKKAHERKCLIGRCEFQAICCYFRRFENYGEVVI